MTTVATNSPMMSGDSQPSCGASMSAYVSAPTPAMKRS